MTDTTTDPLLEHLATTPGVATIYPARALANTTSAVSDQHPVGVLDIGIDGTLTALETGLAVGHRLLAFPHSDARDIVVRIVSIG